MGFGVEPAVPLSGACALWEPTALTSDGTRVRPRVPGAQQQRERQRHPCSRWAYKTIREMHKRRYQLQAVGSYPPGTGRDSPPPPHP